MNKKTIISILLIMVLIMSVFILTGCNENKEENKNNTSATPTPTATATAATNTAKEDQTGTAGSNIPLKDNLTEAENQIKIAFKKDLEKAYGSDISDITINVTKMYTVEEEKANEILKEKNLGPNEVAFEVSYSFKIADGVTDVNKFLAATGTYDESTRMVKDKFNLGIIRPDGDGYKLTDVATGW